MKQNHSNLKVFILRISGRTRPKGVLARSSTEKKEINERMRFWGENPTIQHPKTYFKNSTVKSKTSLVLFSFYIYKKKSKTSLANMFLLAFENKVVLENRTQ